MKRWVVRPVRNSLSERIVGDRFLKVLNYSYSALRLPGCPVAEALEGKWGNRRTVEKRRDTLPEVG